MKEIFNWQIVEYEKKLSLSHLGINAEIVWHEYEYITRLEDIFDAILKNDWSVVCAVVGPPRVGKTTFATWLFYRFYKYKGLNDYQILRKVEENFIFDLDTNIFSKQKECIVFNEAFLTAYKRRSMSETNIKIVEYLTVLQRLNNLIIVIIPFYNQLDKELRTNFVDIIFKIKRRGVVEIFTKYEHYYGIRRHISWKKVNEVSFPLPPKDLLIRVNNLDIAKKMEIVEKLSEKEKKK